MPQLSTLEHDRAPDLVPQVQAFFEYWKGLRGAELVPTLDTWLTHLTASLAMHKFRAELHGEDAMVLFSGSALIARRGRNNTGESLYGMDSRRRAAGMWNLHQAAAHTCGVALDIHYLTTAKRPLVTHTLILPVGVLPGRMPQVIGFSVESPERQPQEVIASQGYDHIAQWIDVGAGVPPLPPR